MNTQTAKKIRITRRAQRTRSKIWGTSERPRLSVHRSLQHISAQLIDDVKHQTVAGVSDEKMKGNKTQRAQLVGKGIAEAAQKLKITQVVFDRGSYLYHGRVKALAEAARQQGLKF